MMANTEAARLSSEFLRHVYELPQGKSIDKCIQCGTCSASCPTSSAMEYGPREIIAALRAGVLEKVLKSNTVWLCASCYSCSVRCPAKIPFTDVMYELKRLGVKHNLYPPDTTNAVMARAFTEVVDKHGRNAETTLLQKYYLRTNMFKMFGQMNLVRKLITRGRLEFLPHTIKGIEGFRKMVAAIEKNGET
ncbi:MAG: 4Fe-4S dicluster domain-containing protein [Sedimentisphaerales bacterium]|nr:4Fe-4S dicluster domain-containing protein [Sedimentisphaerales bacterium]